MPSSLTTMTPDGKILVSADSDNSIKVFNIENSKELCTLKEHSSEIQRVAISPDGLTIVTWSEDGCMKV